ncbi:putative low-specificity L-threonine aldolase 2 [Armadillidium vulgare]|nr:putative low-specificity L-threonine aldolase 2 [Armadillidium vulgare]
MVTYSSETNSSTLFLPHALEYRNNAIEMERIIDMRSDTVTLPTKEMKQTMLTAPLGDDVFGEDPTVNALQKKVATLLGKEDALFVPSGTMANLICVLGHCWSRGAEVILGDQTHIFLFEQGGIAQLGGVHPRPLPNLPDGTFSIELMENVFRNNNIHFPVTSLVCIENTHNLIGGKALPLKWVDEVGRKCKELGSFTCRRCPTFQRISSLECSSRKIGERRLFC